MTKARNKTIYDWIEDYTPLSELLPRILKEERPCQCDDPRVRVHFEEDGAVLLKAFPYMDRFTPGVYIRAERACGLVLWIDAALWGIDTVTGNHFWYLIFRRVEKQCESLYRVPAPVLSTVTKERKPKQDRQRHSVTWRGRR